MISFYWPFIPYSLLRIIFHNQQAVWLLKNNTRHKDVLFFITTLVGLNQGPLPVMNLEILFINVLEPCSSYWQQIPQEDQNQQ